MKLLKQENNGPRFAPSKLYLRTSASKKGAFNCDYRIFREAMDLEVAKQAIHDFPNVELVDNPAQSEYPMPINYVRSCALCSWSYAKN